jgi:hypothetical protein
MSLETRTPRVSWLSACLGFLIIADFEVRRDRARVVTVILDLEDILNCLL